MCAVHTCAHMVRGVRCKRAELVPVGMRNGRPDTRGADMASLVLEVCRSAVPQGRSYSMDQLAAFDSLSGCQHILCALT